MPQRRTFYAVSIGSQWSRSFATKAAALKWAAWCRKSHLDDGADVVVWQGGLGGIRVG